MQPQTQTPKQRPKALRSSRNSATSVICRILGVLNNGARALCTMGAIINDAAADAFYWHSICHDLSSEIVTLLTCFAHVITCAIAPLEKYSSSNFDIFNRSPRSNTEAYMYICRQPLQALVLKRRTSNFDADDKRHVRV